MPTPETGGGIKPLRYSDNDNDKNAGLIEGDYDGRNDNFNPDRPFDPDVPTIEEKAASTLDVIGAGADIYYADAGQDVYITVRLSNPDSYEIMSFTLNGKKYSSYMFEEGSDMENLVLKVDKNSLGGGINEYTIDAIKYIDGTDIKDVRMDGDRTVKIGVRVGDDMTRAVIANEQIGLTSVQFDVSVVDDYSLISRSEGYAKAALYDGLKMIYKDIALDGTTTHVAFDNLLPNTLYQYAVVALYDNLGGDGVQLNTLHKRSFYTDTIVLFADVELTQTGASWSYTWHESAKNKQITALQLTKDGSKVRDLSADTTSVDGLLSDNQYTLTATYKNTYGADGSIEITFATVAKTVPTAEISNAKTAKHTFTADFDFVDPDNIGTITEVALYKGDEKITTTNQRDHITFNELDGDTHYTIVTTFICDLNDGEGQQTLTSKYTLYTLPTFDFVEATCANTSAVTLGETIYFEAIVNNPSGVVVEKIKLNDVYYTPSAGTTKNSIIVNINVDDQFEGGNTQLVVTEIIGTIRGETISIIPDTNNVATVFVNGELKVKSISVVDENNNECDMVVRGKQYYYLLQLNNKTGYKIEQVVLSEAGVHIDQNSFEVLNDETIRIRFVPSYNVGNVKVVSIRYSNESVGSKTKDLIETIETKYIRVDNETPHVITTADQLLNASGYCVLGNDIDLKGKEWNPRDFYGYFDGQGYSIKNMNLVGTVEGKNLNWGLFSSASGVIKNLSVSGRLIVTITPADKQSRQYVGGICGGAGDLTLDNVSSDVTISITLTREGFDGKYGHSAGENSIYAGGLVGDAFGDISIIDSCNNGNITVNSTDEVRVGGLIANCGHYSDLCNVKIVNACNNGTITATSFFQVFVGGLIGENSSRRNDALVSKCLNTGDIIASGWYVGVGGLIWFSSAGVIDQCSNTGNITVSGWNVLVGGLHENFAGGVITNCFNSGKINATGTSPNTASQDLRVGGLICECSGLMYNCYNSGNITATASERTGELVSDFGNDIANCYNSGSVLENKLTGIVWNDDAVISNCFGSETPLEKVIAAMHDKWDNTIWDFDNTDADGNPTLRWQNKTSN